MAEETGPRFIIKLADGRTIYGQPRPEDTERVGLLMAKREIVVLAAARPERESDVAGHAVATEVELDVEGHAITLRLPTATDAEALRKALIVGAMTATIVAAGAAAALQGNRTSTPQSITQPVAAPAPVTQLSVQRESRFSQVDAEPQAEPGVVGPPPAEPSRPDTRHSRSGPLEFDR